MVYGYSDFVSEVAQRQRLSPLPAQNEFNVVDDVALLWADNVWSRDALLSCMPIARPVPADSQPTLQPSVATFTNPATTCSKSRRCERYVDASAQPRVKLKGRSGCLSKAGSRVPYHILDDIDCYAEPVAAVSLNADRVS